MSKKEIKKPRTEEQQLLCILRKKMNVVTEAELKKKNFVCTFDKKTKKLTSIKTNNTAENNDVVEKIKQQLLEKCHIKITLTASHNIRSCVLLNELPKEKSRKKSKSKKNDVTEQSEKNAA